MCQSPDFVILPYLWLVILQSKCNPFYDPSNAVLLISSIARSIAHWNASQSVTFNIAHSQVINSVCLSVIPSTSCPLAISNLDFPFHTLLRAEHRTMSWTSRWYSQLSSSADKVTSSKNPSTELV